MANTLYNHMCDIAFVVISTSEDPEHITTADLIEGLELRVAYLKTHLNEVQEAVGFSDSYEEEYDITKPIEEQQLSTFCSEHIKRRLLNGRGV